MLVPVAESVVGAGAGAVGTDVEYLPFGPSPAIRDHHFIAVRARGSCLSPTILDGDLVIIDRDIPNPRDGDILAIIINGEEVLRVLAGNNLIAYNQHGPVALDEHIVVIGVVVGSFKRFR